ncbi:MAG: hypothetical protein LC775_02295, partial [Acidobacteria bacterium]|nr:hypothetical protein [Acidobacteriota bacterium]
MRYVEDARDRFFEFAQHRDTAAYQDDFTHLQDYLAAWLEESDGVEYTGRSYESWLETAIHVAGALFKDPSLLDYSGTPKTETEYAADPTDDAHSRRVVGIVDPSDSSSW